MAWVGDKASDTFTAYIDRCEIYEINVGGYIRVNGDVTSSFSASDTFEVVQCSTDALNEGTYTVTGTPSYDGTYTTINVVESFNSTKTSGNISIERTDGALIARQPKATRTFAALDASATPDMNPVIGTHSLSPTNNGIKTDTAGHTGTNYDHLAIFQSALSLANLEAIRAFDPTA
jgi:hypothetical protein